MNYDQSASHRAIREGVAAIMTRVDDRYRLARDEDGEFPGKIHTAMAEAAKHGGAMAAASAAHVNLFGPHPIVGHGTAEHKTRWIPRRVAGADQVCLGVTEPDAGLDTTRIRTFAKRAAGRCTARGQKLRTSTARVANKILWLTRTTPIEERRRPSDGMTIVYTDMDRGKITVTRIRKMGRRAGKSNSTYIDDLFIPGGDRIGEKVPGLEKSD